MAMTADDSYCANILAICATRNGAYAPIYWHFACKVLSTVLKFGKIENTMLHVQLQRPIPPNPRAVSGTRSTGLGSSGIVLSSRQSTEFLISFMYLIYIIQI